MAVLSSSLVREVDLVQRLQVSGGFEGHCERNQGSEELGGICVPNGAFQVL